MQKSALKAMSVQQLQQYKQSLQKSCLDMRLLIDSCKKEQQHLVSANAFLDEYANKLTQLRQQCGTTAWEIVWSKGEQGLLFIKKSGVPSKISLAISGLPLIHSLQPKDRLKGLWHGMSNGLHKGYEKSKSWVNWMRGTEEGKSKYQEQGVENREQAVSRQEKGQAKFVQIDDI